MTDDTTPEDPGAPDGGGATGRRAFMAGAAGLAAGATLLGAGGPAGATPPASGEHDLALKWLDMSGPGVLDDVDLGTGGFAKGIFSAFGDMAAVTVRIKVGAGADTGTGPWCVRAVDMPTGYVPATPPDDMTPTGTSSWQGQGVVIDFTSVNQNSYALGASWNNFTSGGGPGVLMVWGFADRSQGTGASLLNFAGTVPFGAPLAEGAMVYSTQVYLREPEEE